MGKTIKEAMKRINFLDQQINHILQEERLNSYVEYIDNKDKEVSDYDFDRVTQDITNLQDEVLKIRKAINQANQNTLVGVGDLSISDALIQVAQYTRNSNRFQELASYKQKSRSVNYTDTVEYNERLYDVKVAQEKYMDCIEKIHELQTAIDKANILTEIDY